MNNDRYIFRGERLDDGELIYGNHVSGIFFDGVNKETAHYIMTGDFIDYDCFEDFSENYGYYEVDPETIGQCTGLRDKNGTVAFEGDIVKDRERGIFVIEWDKEIFSWQAKNVMGEDCVTYFDFFLDEISSFEIIGNVYENPELLEGMRNA